VRLDSVVRTGKTAVWAMTLPSWLRPRGSVGDCVVASSEITSAKKARH